MTFELPMGDFVIGDMVFALPHQWICWIPHSWAICTVVLLTQNQILIRLYSERYSNLQRQRCLHLRTPENVKEKRKGTIISTASDARFTIQK